MEALSTVSTSPLMPVFTGTNAAKGSASSKCLESSNSVDPLVWLQLLQQKGIYPRYYFEWVQHRVQSFTMTQNHKVWRLYNTKPSVWYSGPGNRVDQPQYRSSGMDEADRCKRLKQVSLHTDDKFDSTKATWSLETHKEEPSTCPLGKPIVIRPINSSVKDLAPYSHPEDQSTSVSMKACRSDVVNMAQPNSTVPVLLQRSTIKADLEPVVSADSESHPLHTPVLLHRATRFSGSDQSLIDDLEQNLSNMDLQARIHDQRSEGRHLHVQLNTSENKLRGGLALWNSFHSDWIDELVQHANYAERSKSCPRSGDRSRVCRDSPSEDRNHDKLSDGGPTPEIVEASGLLQATSSSGTSRGSRPRANARSRRQRGKGSGRPARQHNGPGGHRDDDADSRETNHDNGGNDRQNEPPNALGEDEDGNKLFVSCLYAMWDPERYASCRRFRLTKIAELKQHLQRVHNWDDHSNNRCSYCHVEYKDGKYIEQHHGEGRCEQRVEPAERLRYKIPQAWVQLYRWYFNENPRYKFPWVKEQTVEVASLFSKLSKNDLPHHCLQELLSASSRLTQLDRSSMQEGFESGRGIYFGEGSTAQPTQATQESPTLPNYDWGAASIETLTPIPFDEAANAMMRPVVGDPGACGDQSARLPAPRPVRQPLANNNAMEMETTPETAIQNAHNAFPEMSGPIPIARGAEDTLPPMDEPTIDLDLYATSDMQAQIDQYRQQSWENYNINPDPITNGFLHTTDMPALRSNMVQAFYPLTHQTMGGNGPWHHTAGLTENDTGSTTQTPMWGTGGYGTVSTASTTPAIEIEDRMQGIVGMQPTVHLRDLEFKYMGDHIRSHENDWTDLGAPASQLPAP